MPKRKSLLILAIFASFNLACFTASQHAQDGKAVETDANKPKFVAKVNKLEGWNVPSADEKELVSSTESSEEGETVTAKTYKFQKPVELRIDIFSANSDGSINMGYEIVEAKGMTAYSIKGKTFSYAASGLVLTSNDNGSIGCGCLLSKVFFSDEDGDDKFELMRIGTDIKNEIPSRLKTKKTSPSPKSND